MTSIRGYLNYANIVAPLALLFAMSGGALAAKHYLITSTTQISPKVLRKLKAAGKTGPVGTRGAAGATGAAGPQGVSGSAPAAIALPPANSPLPSGQSES